MFGSKVMQPIYFGFLYELYWAWTEANAKTKATNEFVRLPSIASSCLLVSIVTTDGIQCEYIRP